MQINQEAPAAHDEPMPADNYQFIVLDHVCRICLHRLLAREDEDGNTVICCLDCGVEVVGSPHEMCACGVTLKSGKDAGLRCMVNEHPTPEAPREIGIGYVEVEHEERNPVRRRVQIADGRW